MPVAAPFHQLLPVLRGEKAKKVYDRQGNMTLSCIKCGFFVRIKNLSSKYIGYCLFFKPRDIQREVSKKGVNISGGEEFKIAENCEGYFDVSNISAMV